jgi:hypothetical protein
VRDGSADKDEGEHTAERMFLVESDDLFDLAL